MQHKKRAKNVHDDDDARKMNFPICLCFARRGLLFRFFLSLALVYGGALLSRRDEEVAPAHARAYCIPDVSIIIITLTRLPVVSRE